MQFCTVTADDILVITLDDDPNLSILEVNDHLGSLAFDDDLDVPSVGPAPAAAATPDTAGDASCLQSMVISMYFAVAWEEPRMVINESAVEWRDARTGPTDVRS